MSSAPCHPELPIKALGLCRFCYNKQYRSTRKDLDAKRHKAWREANYCRFPKRLKKTKPPKRIKKIKVAKPPRIPKPIPPPRPPKIKQDIETKKLKLKLAVKKWRERNPGRGAAIQAKRRSSKLKRTPNWANLAAIKQFYINCPEGMTVDHIIPLQGKNVSGLHVHYNLQYLSATENSSKNNRYEL